MPLAAAADHCDEVLLMNIPESEVVRVCIFGGEEGMKLGVEVPIEAWDVGKGDV